MNIDEMIANKVFEQLGPDFVEGVIEQIDTKKVADMITKSIIAGIKDIYWGDVLNDAFDSKVTKVLTEKLVAALKG